MGVLSPTIDDDDNRCLVDINSRPRLVECSYAKAKRMKLHWQFSQVTAPEPPARATGVESREHPQGPRSLWAEGGSGHGDSGEAATRGRLSGSTYYVPRASRLLLAYCLLILALKGKLLLLLLFYYHLSCRRKETGSEGEVICPKSHSREQGWGLDSGRSDFKPSPFCSTHPFS